MSAAANDELSLHQVIAAAVKEALDKRLPTLAAVGLVPPRYVQLSVAAILTGYSERALQSKIDEGVWLEGKEWRKAPDGRRLVDLEGYNRWVEGGRRGE